MDFCSTFEGTMLHLKQGIIQSTQQSLEISSLSLSLHEQKRGLFTLRTNTAPNKQFFLFFCFLSASASFLGMHWRDKQDAAMDAALMLALALLTRHITSFPAQGFGWEPYAKAGGTIIKTFFLKKNFKSLKHVTFYPSVLYSKIDTKQVYTYVHLCVTKARRGMMGGGEREREKGINGLSQQTYPRRLTPQ